MRPLVVDVEDPGTGTTRRHAFLRSPVRIGRGDDADLVLRHPFVSARHAIVEFDAWAVRYTDLGSRNGSTLDGAPIAAGAAAAVVPQARLGIGPLRLSFSRGEETAAGEDSRRSVAVRPGALSELMQALARTPEFDPADAWARSLRPGLAVGRFVLVRELGRGGFGVVFEARDRQLGRRVALKAMRPGEQPARLREAWLQAEAEAAAQLNHPNIVTLFDAGSWEGGPYLIMELLEGEGLDARLARGPLDVDEALGVALDVARALAHAHRSGVVHRDLKPSNVFLTAAGWAKVLDFGLAHVFGAEPIAGGTPRYASPGQRRHEPPDARDDVYSAAVVLHEMLTGSLAEPGAPSLPGPPALGAVVAAALSPDPENRPRDGGAWLEALLVCRGA